MPRRLALALLALMLVLSACGEDEGQEPAAAGSPHRIVSASATHTEILYAIGAGDAVIATDDFSDYPAAALTTEKIDAFNLNVEAVAALDPDLVVLNYDPGDAVESLETLGIPVLFFVTPVTVEEAYDQIAAMGEATGRTSEANDLISSMKTRIGEIVAGVDLPEDLPTFFHEVDGTLYSVTSATFLGSVYALFGLVNIADPADNDGFGYPQLSSEYILSSDPDFIFLGDVAYGESAERVAQRPGWDTLSAVAAGRVVELDSDLASRWGPRLVDFVASIADALSRAGTP